MATHPGPLWGQQRARGTWDGEGHGEYHLASGFAGKDRSSHVPWCSWITSLVPKCPQTCTSVAHAALKVQVESG